MAYMVSLKDIQVFQIVLVYRNSMEPFFFPGLDINTYAK